MGKGRQGGNRREDSERQSRHDRHDHPMSADRSMPEDRPGADDPEDESDLGSFREALGPVAPYLGLGMQLAGIVLFFMGIGYVVDVVLDTPPLFLVAGALVGIVMMFVQLVRAANDMSRRSEKP